MSGARRQDRAVTSETPEAVLWEMPFERTCEALRRARRYRGMKTSWILTGDDIFVLLY